ncbi:hypothetical protein F0562_005284 [Nyssa sinensis]|uniref:Uncharacterized protein n=1 Tax=Nyssa sinensis TaxID=561372 RepID=A0A5J5AHN0_9ASTE|nr:hypothetical protein F0562_005284 [Nyssa sinensis]
MGFWGTKYKCLHFQLESFFGFIYIASNCIWQLSSKLLQKCWLCLITCTTYQGRPKQILDYWNHRGNSQAGY